MRREPPDWEALCWLCQHPRRLHAVVGVWCAKCEAKCEGKYGDTT